MEKKRGVSAVWMLGVIFTPLGGIFLILGVVLLFALRDTPVWSVGIPFAAIGALFLVLGIVFLAADGKHRRRLRALREGGRCLWGEIISLEPNTMMRINNRHPYFAKVRYADGFGKEFIFQSESSMELWKREDLIGRQVKVYIQDNTCANYYVDISSVLR